MCTHTSTPMPSAGGMSRRHFLIAGAAGLVAGAIATETLAGTPLAADFKGKDNGPGGRRGHRILPRFYLYWQSGFNPRERPDHLQIVREAKPDLFGWPGFRGGLPPGGINHIAWDPTGGEFKPGNVYLRTGDGDEAKDEEERKKRLESIKPQWWTKEEYEANMAQAAETIKWIKEQTGVYGGMGSINSVLIEGDSGKRLRFWAFYDHWNLYEEWYGPRPPTDPWEWIQTLPGGKKWVVPFMKPGEDGSRMYACCPNSPFSQYLANYVKIGAQSGLHGSFADDPLFYGGLCLCSFCQKEWQEFLRQRFTKDELKKYFGLEEYEAAKPHEKPFELESQRFMAYSMGRHLGRLKAAGESVWGKGNYWLAPNGSTIAYRPTGRGLGAVEWAKQGAGPIWFREVNLCHEGIDVIRLGRDLYLNTTDDLILGHKMARGLSSSQVWAAADRSVHMYGRDEGLYNLAAATELAFDGIMLDMAPPGFPIITDARKAFSQFYRAHDALLRSGPSIAEVGVLCFDNELYLDPVDAVRECQLVTDWLSEARVLWDAVMDDNLSLKSLSKYKVVFVPNTRMLDDREVEVLLGYARGGGQLILSGEVGTAYRCGVKRAEPAFVSVYPRAQDKEAFVVSSYGRGRIAYCPQGFADVDVPEIYKGTDTFCEHPARALILETNRKVFLDCLNEVVGESLSAILPPGPRAVRIAARWFEEEDGAMMMVHLANFDLHQKITLGKGFYKVLREPSKLVPAKDIRVVVPVPAGYRVQKASWVEYPEKQTKELKFEALRGGVQFTVPEVKIYSFVAISLTQGESKDKGGVAEARGKRTSTEGALPIIELEGKPSSFAGARASADKSSAAVVATKTEPAEMIFGAELDEAKLGEVLHVTTGTPILVSGTAGEELVIRLAKPGQKEKKVDESIWTILQAINVHAMAERGQARWTRFWLLSPSGKMVASGAVPADRTTLIKVSASESGLYVLLTEGGLGGRGALAVSTPSRALMATGDRLRFEDPNSELYFYVPRGTREFEVTLRGLDYKMRIKLFDASNTLRLQRDDINSRYVAHKIAVPEGQDGKVWKFAFSTDTPAGQRAKKQTYVDLAPPLSGFVSPHPSRLVVVE